MGIREFEKSAIKYKLFTEIEKQHKFFFSTAKITYKEIRDEVNLNYFGDIGTQFTKSPVDTIEYGHKGAQMPDMSETIEQLHITLVTTHYNIISRSCFGCTILSNQRFLIADHSNNKLIYDNQNSVVEDEMALQTTPYDITSLKGHNFVAVTRGDEELLIDLERKCITKKTQLNFYGCG